SIPDQDPRGTSPWGPAMRIVLTVIGAILGLGLASGSLGLFGLLLGAGIGFGIAELVALRVKLGELEDDLGELTRSVAQHQRRQTEGQGAAAGQGTLSGWRAAAGIAPESAPASEPRVTAKPSSVSAPPGSVARDSVQSTAPRI